MYDVMMYVSCGSFDSKVLLPESVTYRQTYHAGQSDPNM